MVKTVTVRNVECSPINKKSAMAISGGYAYESELDISRRVYDAPLNTQRVPIGVKDLTGTKVGRVTIVGHLGESELSSGRKWLGRCVCGKYIIRTGYSWRAKLNKNGEDRGCIHCMEMDYLKNKASQLSSGVDPLSYRQWRRIHVSKNSKSC